MVNRYRALALGVALLALSGCGELRQSSDSTTEDTTAATSATLLADEGLLSAFFGLDDAIPRLAGLIICPGAVGEDGLPVVFSRELRLESLQAGDFRIIKASGEPSTVRCVTPAPANDAGELRTMLLLGALGSVDDPPVRVEIIGNLLSIDETVNFKGASVAVTPLADGPFLVRAEPVPVEQWQLGKSATRFPFGGGSGCPEGTTQIVRATWSGGVTRPGGAEVGALERDNYVLALRQADGRITRVQPFALGDLGDGDNNHLLCLKDAGQPVEVSFPAGLMTDPREDLNPATSIGVSESAFTDKPG